MIRLGTVVLLLALVLGCAKTKAEKPLSVAGEKLYTLEGTVVRRDASENSLTIDHKAIANFMEAMTMDYPVRGAKVDALPPNGAHITASLHVTDDQGIWLTDVKKIR